LVGESVSRGDGSLRKEGAKFAAAAHSWNEE
jgi:hypothetical protein